MKRLEVRAQVVESWVSEGVVVVWKGGKADAAQVVVETGSLRGSHANRGSEGRSD